MIASSVLASYETLLPFYSNPQSLVQQMTLVLTKDGIRWYEKLLLDAKLRRWYKSRDPLLSLREDALRLRSLFGTSFDISVQDDITEDSQDSEEEEKLEQQLTASSFLFVRVHKCFYHSFFSANKVSFLTPVMCAWDRHLLELMQSTAQHISCKRKGSLPEDKPHCKFVFRTKVQAKIGRPSRGWLSRIRGAAPSFQYQSDPEEAAKHHSRTATSSDTLS